MQSVRPRACLPNSLVFLHTKPLAQQLSAVNPHPMRHLLFFAFFKNIYIYFEVGKCLGGKWFFLQSKTELFRFLIRGDCAEEGWMIFFRWGLTWRIEILKTCEMARKRARLSSPRGQSLFPPIKIRLCHWRRDYSTPKKKEEKKKRHSFLKRKAVSCWTAAQLPSSETENREGWEEKKTQRLQFLICQRVHPSPNGRRGKY